ncbi:hypothetical protein SAMN05660282_00445 [Corynebacterium spheniscorum]|uniref:Uncharacterized protein n=1 Tax=Corynebacterium spheniscorum TaxID=185761 RepID=A0A1I2QGN9_9CORY|nr:hypothetical protein SAMN05660282_00445 [Corynebacterium spheniscorum]
MLLSRARWFPTFFGAVLGVTHHCRSLRPQADPCGSVNLHGVSTADLRAAAERSYNLSQTTVMRLFGLGVSVSQNHTPRSSAPK